MGSTSLHNVCGFYIPWLNHKNIQISFNVSIVKVFFCPAQTELLEYKVLKDMHTHYMGVPVADLHSSKLSIVSRTHASALLAVFSWINWVTHFLRDNFRWIQRSVKFRMKTKKRWNDQQLLWRKFIGNVFHFHCRKKIKFQVNRSKSPISRGKLYAYKIHRNHPISFIWIVYDSPVFKFISKKHRSTKKLKMQKQKTEK